MPRASDPVDPVDPGGTAGADGAAGTAGAVDHGGPAGTVETAGAATLRSTHAPDWSLERALWAAGALHVAGVDEAGRGALAGPVVAAAVILPPERAYPFRDSKTVPPRRRALLAVQVRDVAVAWAVGLASAEEIDAVGILTATKNAARRALDALTLTPDALVTDYLPLAYGVPEVTPPRADARSYQVAAASIVAKVTRDEIMVALHDEHPAYGFDRHKGYAAPYHVAALARLGPCPSHRRTFGRVLSVPLFEPSA
ncbi:MAG: ribonuclease HII [Trueperaceae bacterium]